MWWLESQADKNRKKVRISRAMKKTHEFGHRDDLQVVLVTSGKVLVVVVAWAVLVVVVAWAVLVVVVVVAWATVEVLVNGFSGVVEMRSQAKQNGPGGLLEKTGDPCSGQSDPENILLLLAPDLILEPQEHRSCLKTWAPWNMPLKSVTLETSQLERSWLKAPAF